MMYTYYVRKVYVRMYCIVVVIFLVPPDIDGE